MYILYPIITAVNLLDHISGNLGLSYGIAHIHCILEYINLHSLSCFCYVILAHV